MRPWQSKFRGGKEWPWLLLWFQQGNVFWISSFSILLMGLIFEKFFHAMTTLYWLALVLHAAECINATCMLILINDIYQYVQKKSPVLQEQFLITHDRSWCINACAKYVQSKYVRCVRMQKILHRRQYIHGQESIYLFLYIYVQKSQFDSHFNEFQIPLKDEVYDYVRIIKD